MQSYTLLCILLPFEAPTLILFMTSNLGTLGPQCCLNTTRKCCVPSLQSGEKGTSSFAQSQHGKEQRQKSMCQRDLKMSTCGWTRLTSASQANHQYHKNHLTGHTRKTDLLSGTCACLMHLGMSYELNEDLHGATVIAEFLFELGPHILPNVCFYTPYAAPRGKPPLNMKHVHVLTSEQEKWNRKVRRLRSHVEFPFAKIKQTWGCLVPFFKEDKEQMDYVVALAIGVHNFRKK